MNDYKDHDYNLINRLLKDKSEASILKLKMIVNLETIILFKIMNQVLFVKIFHDYYSKLFEKKPWYLIGVHGCCTYKIVKIFLNSFKSATLKYPSVIQYIPLKEQIKFAKLMKKEYRHVILTKPGSTEDITCVDNNEEFVKLFKKEYLKYFATENFCDLRFVNKIMKILGSK